MKALSFQRLLGVLEIRMAGLAVLLGLILSMASPHFLTSSNIFNLMDQSVVIGIVAIGMTFVILTGGVDLSVGSVAGLTGIILGLALREWPIPLAIAAAIMAGALIGTGSGLLVAVFGLAPFVVTLGMMAICRSLAFVLSGQRSISDIPDGLSVLVYGDAFGLPMNVAILLALYAAAWAYLSHARGGRIIYALGSNKAAARGETARPLRQGRSKAHEASFTPLPRGSNRFASASSRSNPSTGPRGACF